MNAFNKFKQVFKISLKLYGIIHLLPVVIFKRKQLLKEPLAVIKRTIMNIFGSCCYLASYVAVFWYCNCFFKNLTGRIDKWSIVYSSFICSFTCFFEAPSRRTELALYMFPRMLESLFLMAEKRGYVRSIPNGEVLVFALAMAVLMYCY